MVFSGTLNTATETVALPGRYQGRRRRPRFGTRGACAPEEARGMVFSGTLNTATETVALPGRYQGRRRRPRFDTRGACAPEKARGMVFSGTLKTATETVALPGRNQGRRRRPRFGRGHAGRVCSRKSERDGLQRDAGDSDRDGRAPRKAPSPCPLPRWREGEGEAKVAKAALLDFGNTPEKAGVAGVFLRRMKRSKPA